MEAIPDEILLMVINFGTEDDEPFDELDPRFICKSNVKVYSKFLLKFSQVCRRFRRLVPVQDVVVYPSMFRIKRVPGYLDEFFAACRDGGSRWRFRVHVAPIFNGTVIRAVDERIERITTEVCQAVENTDLDVKTLSYYVDTKTRDPLHIEDDVRHNLTRMGRCHGMDDIYIQTRSSRNIYCWNTQKIEL